MTETEEGNKGWSSVAGDEDERSLDDEDERRLDDEDVGDDISDETATKRQPQDITCNEL